MSFIQLAAACASLLVASAAMAAPTPAAGERALGATQSTTLLARETESGDDRGARGRGRGGDDAGRGGHKAFEEAPATVIAREAERGDDRGDDGEEFEIDDHA